MQETLFDQLPAAISAPIKEIFPKLKNYLQAEGIVHFEKIIAEFGEEEIYTLSFYYNAGDWGYIFPTFSTEKGLEEVAEEYMENGGGSLEDNKSQLRWSPCDSPHHGFDYFFSERVEDELYELERLTIKASNFIEEKDLPDRNGYRAHTAVIVEIYQLIHDHAIEALQQVVLSPKVVEYRKKHRCLIVLEAGDMDPDVLNQDLVTLNGETVFDIMKSWN